MEKSMPHRFVSVDVFRGLTIALMVLQISGSGATFSIFQHSEWNGITLADVIFPMFIFILGFSIVLSSRKLYRIMERTIILFLLGLLVNGFPFFNLDTLRIMGVLQRLAICYLLSSIIYMKLRVKYQVLLVTSILIVYSFISGYGTNLGTFLLNGQYTPTFDSEGILSTLGALASAILGLLAGEYLLTLKEQNKKLLALGFLSLVLGLLLNPLVPFNKLLWTSSFVLFTNGVSVILLSVLFYLIEARGYKRVFRPFQILGLNAIFVYVLSEVLTLSLITWMNIELGFLYGLENLSICWFIAAIMYTKRIFVKV